MVAAKLERRSGTRMNRTPSHETRLRLLSHPHPRRGRAHGAALVVWENAGGDDGSATSVSEPDPDCMLPHEPVNGSLHLPLRPIIFIEREVRRQLFPPHSRSDIPCNTASVKYMGHLSNQTLLHKTQETHQKCNLATFLVSDAFLCVTHRRFAFGRSSARTQSGDTPSTTPLATHRYAITSYEVNNKGSKHASNSTAMLPGNLSCSFPQKCRDRCQTHALPLQTAEILQPCV